MREAIERQLDDSAYSVKFQWKYISDYYFVSVLNKTLSYSPGIIYFFPFFIYFSLILYNLVKRLCLHSEPFPGPHKCSFFTKSALCAKNSCSIWGCTLIKGKALGCFISSVDQALARLRWKTRWHQVCSTCSVCSLQTLHTLTPSALHTAGVSFREEEMALNLRLKFIRGF